MKDITVSPDCTIKDALKKLEKTAEKVLLVVDKFNVFQGTLSDGDIRRCILNGVEINSNIGNGYNENSSFVYEDDYNEDKVKDIFLNKKISLIPILDRTRKVVDISVWNEVLGNKKHYNSIDIPVVIMAGGKGSRLAPFTDIFPKPLIPINNKPILEIIIDGFLKFGISDYYLTLNYKGEMIKAYFDGKDDEFKYKLNFAWEKEFNGTAASLNLLKDNLPDVFIVSNCDIIVNVDYAKVLDFHLESKSELTILSSIQHHVIPYGVVDYSNGGVVNGLIEKPEYTHTINTGVYIMNKNCLDLIPQDTFFHMTDLIDIMLQKKIKVTTFPVNANDYTDIGQWAEYKEAKEKLRNL